MFSYLPISTRASALLVAGLLVAALPACGDDEVAAGSATPWSSDQSVVIGGAGGPTVHATPDGDDCIDVGDECVQPQRECGDDARADVVVDADGKVVRIVCYPGDEGVSFDRSEGSEKSVADDTVLVLDAEDDGDDITNNVEFKGNGAVLYGHGPDVSVVGGNLKIIGDDAVVRSLRIKQNLHVDGSGATIIDCVVEGNVHIKGGQNVLAGCVVWGDVKVEGGEHALVANRAAKNWDVAEEYVCSDNVAVEDADDDLVIDDGELGPALSCPQKYP